MKFLPLVFLCASFLCAQEPNELADLLEHAPLRKQQKALASLAKAPGPAADEVLLKQFNRLNDGKLPLGLWLDLFEAAAQREDPRLQSAVREYQARNSNPKDPLRMWMDCLEGGRASVGRVIFTEQLEAGCIRCHRFGNEGGSIGPDLTGLSGTFDRIYILQSIVEPSAVISPGFDQLLLTLKDDTQLNAILNFESEEELSLTSLTDGKKFKLHFSEVRARASLPSAMPPGLAQILGKRALRDLVEFLASPP